MKTLLSILLVLVAGSVGAQTLETLQSIRWHALWLENVSEDGTSLVDTTDVDSFVNVNLQTVGTDFALTSYNTNEKLDTFTFTQNDPTNRVQQDTLNSDFIPGGLLWAKRKAQGAEQYYVINVGLPDVTSLPPSEEDQLSTVWASAGTLHIQPATQSKDIVIIAYRALPAKMVHVDSAVGMGPALRDMVMRLTAADIQHRLGNYAAEDRLRAQYAAFKSERLILPAAALSGGGE